MSALLTGHREGFKAGFTAVTTVDDASGIALGVLKLAAGAVHRVQPEHETAWLLLHGALASDGQDIARRSLFDDAPKALHVCAGVPVAFKALDDCELLVCATANTRAFGPMLYTGAKDEHRGRGAVADAAHRIVRTVFDTRNAPPQAELVLGEVVNFPGRWSSWPPHHHAQPELYHYRFDRPHGYGHAELGDQVFKVRANDTLRILDGANHAQCAAPGYAMWYAWVVRHLPGAKYEAVTFEEQHRWTMEPGAGFWAPSR